MDSSESFMSQAHKLLYQIPEAAEALGRSRSRIYELIATQQLDAVKDGRSTLVTAESLRRFADGLRDRGDQSAVDTAPSTTD